MTTETVTSEKTPYPKNIPDGYIVLTAVKVLSTSPIRLQIVALISYHADDEGTTVVTLSNGTKVRVMETPEMIDALITTFSISPR